MPILKSSIKQVRRVKQQTSINRIRKSKYKSTVKQIMQLIDQKKKKEAIKFLSALNSQLMKVAKTGSVDKKKASRKISRITKQIYSLKN